jgi:hypothetical protein
MSADPKVHELRVRLQQAVELEHATIPAYLYALYSLKPGTNLEIAGLIRSVVMEEMLHMALACNVLNAVGGSPSINHQGFVPDYPSKLPHGIHPTLVVPLAPFSKDLIKNVFMVIEEPDLTDVPGQGPPEHYRHTIGDFYRRIEHLLGEVGPGAFTGDPARQVTQWRGTGQLIAVTDPASAKRALDEIVEQGEGASPLDPDDADQELAHYYKFDEIYRGRRLVFLAPEGWQYAGPPVPFDPTGVWPMIDNPKVETLPADSQVRVKAATFNQTYRALLNSLHESFNGAPERIDTAIGVMYALQVQAKYLVQMPADPTQPNGPTAGPPFQWVADC